MISFLLALLACTGAFDSPFPSASSAARGGPDAALDASGDAVEGNPALAAGGGWSAGTDWTRPLGLGGLDQTGVWVRTPGPGLSGTAWRWRALVAGEVYREDQLACDVAAGWNGIRLGGGVRWGRVEVAGRNLGEPVGWAGGLAWEPVAGWAVGASWEDPSGLRSSGMPLPWNLRAGGGWRSADSSWISEVGAWRDQLSPWSWNLGQEWRIEPIRVRLGVRTDPLVLCMGLGATWRAIRIDWGAEVESRFGWQHHLGLSWRM